MAKKKVTENEVVVEKNANVGENNGVENKAEAVEQVQEENPIAKKLLSLYYLQQVYSQIDRILIERGELPNEVRDYEDSLAGIRTRISNYQNTIKEIEQKITHEGIRAAEAQSQASKYEEQQQNVRNSREYETLDKEIIEQKYNISIANKNIEKFKAEIVLKQEEIQRLTAEADEKEEILTKKKSDLEVILAETAEKEAELRKEADIYKVDIEPRLLTAFERIRKNARNGLAIVRVDRNACGGCFSTIPPQRQLDIRLHKKIIVCEACGRIFIDDKLVLENQNQKEAE